MSFWAVLSKDLKIAGKAIIVAGPYIGPAVSLIDPPLGIAVSGIMGKIEAAIAAAESTVTDANNGQIKKDTVIEDWTSALALASSITGKTFTYDPDKLSKAIDTSVSAKNAMAEFVATVKQQ